MRPLNKRLTFVVLLLVASACGDGGGGGDGPDLSIEPASGPPGTEIALSVSGCTSEPNGTLLDSASAEVATATFTDSENGTVTVPDDATAGSYRLSVNCETGTEETEEGTSTTLAADDASFEVTG